jgi:hypothetical protein
MAIHLLKHEQDSFIAKEKPCVKRPSLSIVMNIIHSLPVGF